MKSCIIVNFWGDTTDKINIVKNCLSQLKKTNIDIVYTSKFPISNEINELVNYSIFTKENDLITLDDLLNSDDIDIVNTMSHDIGDNIFYTVPLNYYNVSYSVYTQLNNNLSYLKGLGYTHFHFLVGDCFISNSDLNKFKLIEELLTLSNRKSYFEDLRGKFNGFSSLYFFSEIDNYLNKNKSIQDKQDFIKYYGSKPNDSGSLSFEVILMNNFKDDPDTILSKNDKWEYGHLLTFRNSELDIITSYNTSDVYAIIPDVNHTYSTIYIVSRNGGDYVLKINDESFVYCLPQNVWQSHIVTLPNFNLEITKNNVSEISMEIDTKKLHKIWSYSFLT